MKELKLILALQVVTDVESKKANCSNLTAFSAKFVEPGGICLDENSGKIWIADTNNHQIKILDVQNEILNEFELKSERDVVDFPGFSEPKFDFAVHEVLQYSKEVKQMEIKLNLKLAEGCKINEEAPSSYKVLPSTSGIEVIEGNAGKLSIINKLTIVIPQTEEKKYLSLKLKVFLCKIDSGTCYVKNGKINIQFTAANDIQETKEVHINIE